MWKCPECDEKIDDDLDTCWNCAANDDPEARAEVETAEADVLAPVRRIRRVPLFTGLAGSLLLTVAAILLAANLADLFLNASTLGYIVLVRFAIRLPLLAALFGFGMAYRDGRPWALGLALAASALAMAGGVWWRVERDDILGLVVAAAGAVLAAPSIVGMLGASSERERPDAAGPITNDGRHRDRDSAPPP